ncbi:GntR family transcriptional regulator [Aureimonas pseudogalii]|uniref:GntR family transcriptional regulator n=1 Tax=Aureimonas pseudogalii TaxID=1744844 RepID=A0A7W6MMB1_9HYPH|nr:GntR family transcriptional regulator [Aureimonas pseudogalii]MBB4000604.1 GntR family transcriptional regulator [Aureimonas pseudogalii]
MRQVRGSLPVYLQLTETLVRDIAAGRLVEGEKLPPERDMAGQMGTSIGTLRKALAELQIRGLLERVQGSGNYVRAVRDPKSLYAMFRLELIAGGGLPTAEVLQVDRHDKPDDISAYGPSAWGHRIRRLRRLSGRAMAVEEIWLDGSYVETIGRGELSESLYLFYRMRLGLFIEKVEDQIGLRTVPDWKPSAFEPAVGSSSCHIFRKSWTAEGVIAEVSHTWYDHNVARYVSRFR